MLSFTSPGIFFLNIYDVITWDFFSKSAANHYSHTQKHKHKHTHTQVYRHELEDEVEEDLIRLVTLRVVGAL